jgi:hypothetical protein
MHKPILALCTLLAALASSAVAAEMGTAFTYQGRLCDGGVPANGYYDFECRLYDVASGGSHLDPPGVTPLTAVFVTNGLFTTNIDFGVGVFTGEARWLEISACTNGAGTPVPLLPRQELKPTPYALYATNAGVAASASTVPWGGISGLPSGLDDGDDDTIYSPGTGLELVGTEFRVSTNFLNTLLSGRYWALGGNDGTGATNFVGTLNNQALELRVNGDRALKLQPEVAGTVTVIGGSSANEAVSGSAIAGGGTASSPNVARGSYAFIGSGRGNTNDSTGAVIGGGHENKIMSYSEGAAMGGGYWNHIGAYSDQATIGGGVNNRIEATSSSAPSAWSTISGGRSNRIEAGVFSATISGGALNNIRAESENSTIAGGQGNTIGFQSWDSTIAGGYENAISNYSVYSTVGGGYQNVVRQSSEYSTIGGGFRNTISNSAPRSVIGGGSGNQVWGYAEYSFIGGGDNNDIMDGANQSVVAGGAVNSIGTDSENSFVGGGYDNDIAPQASYTTIAGGLENDVNTNADYATIPGGREAKAADYGQFAYASGNFAAHGDAQASMFVLRRTATGATTNELFLDGNSASRRISVPTNSAWALDILVVGRSTETQEFGATAAAYQVRGLIVHDNLGTRVRYTTTTIWEDYGAWNVTLDTDAADHLLIKVVSTDYTVRWVANVRTAEVTYP